MVRYPLEEIPLESPVVPVGAETFKNRIVALKADLLLAPTPQQSAILNGIPNWRTHRDHASAERCHRSSIGSRVF